jgi:hypothetical protein
VRKALVRCHDRSKAKTLIASTGLEIALQQLV